MLRNLVRLTIRDRWWLVSAAVVGIAVCTLAAWIGRGSFDHFIYAVTIGSYLVAPALLVALGMLVYVVVLGRREVLRIHGFFGSSMGVAFVAAMIPLSFFAGMVFLSLDIDRAQVYCENLVPRLEEWCAENGSYPERIELVEPNPEERPRLLRDGSFYHTMTGESFEFEISDGDALALSGYVYDPHTEEWLHYYHRD